MRLDWTILHEIRAFLTCPLLDMLMPKITMLGNSGAVWILAAVGCSAQRNTGSMGSFCWQVLPWVFWLAMYS